jgi:hypothetical protein
MFGVVLVSAAIRNIGATVDALELVDLDEKIQLLEQTLVHKQAPFLRSN